MKYHYTKYVCYVTKLLIALDRVIFSFLLSSYQLDIIIGGENDKI